MLHVVQNLLIQEYQRLSAQSLLLSDQQTACGGGFKLHSFKLRLNCRNSFTGRGFSHVQVATGECVDTSESDARRGETQVQRSRLNQFSSIVLALIALIVSVFLPVNEYRFETLSESSAKHIKL